MTISAPERAALDRLAGTLPPTALAWFGSVRANDPKLPLNLGVALASGGENQLALRRLRQALLLEPASARAAAALLAVLEPDAAGGRLPSTVLGLLGDAAAWARHGRDMLRQGRPEEGLAALDRALAAEPGNMQWIREAAIVQWHRCRGDAAVARLVASGDERLLFLAFQMAFGDAHDAVGGDHRAALALLRQLQDRLMRAPSRDPDVFKRQLVILLDPAEAARYPGFVDAWPDLMSDPVLAAAAHQLFRRYGRVPDWAHAGSGAPIPAAALQARSVRLEALRSGGPPAASAAGLPGSGRGETADALDRRMAVHLVGRAEVLSGEWFVLRPDGSASADCWFHVPGQERSAYIEDMRPGRLDLRLPQHRIAVDGPAVLIGGADNYYHWTVDFLPRLAGVLSSPALAGRRLIVSQDLVAFERESIARLAVPAGRLIPVPYPAVVRVADLAVVDFGARPLAATGTPAMFRGATPIDVLAALRHRLLRLYGVAPDIAEARRLMVTRRGARLPRLLNEDEIADRLSGYGFEAVTLSGMSVAQQIALFAGAEIVVGAHGAGLTNTLFAPAGATLLELHAGARPPDFYGRIAAAAAVRHGAVQASRTYVDDGKRQWQRYRVEPNAVEAAVRSALGHE